MRAARDEARDEANARLARADGELAVGPHSSCSPRHVMQFKSLIEGVKRGG
jgi:hypothetical protein